MPRLLRPFLARASVAAPRPGLRLLVAVPAIAVVVGMALVVSHEVAGQLRQTATDAALRDVEAIVRGYLDPTLEPESLDLGSTRSPAIDDQFVRLTAPGNLLRINLWSRDGTIVYSSASELRGRRFSIGDRVARAFAGESVASYAATRSTDADDSEHPLPSHYLELFVPVRGAVDGNPIGVYDVYQDARPIEDRVESTRQTVFLVALIAASLLLLLVWLAFSTSSRVLSGQNRRLRDQAAKEQLLLADLRRSEERFRSLVRNSSDTVMVLDADGTIRYESSAVVRVLGLEPERRIGTSALEIVEPDDATFVGQRLAEIGRTAGAETTIEFRARHRDGSLRVLEAVLKNLVNDPAVGGIVVNYRDVTERRALEEQLRHQAFHDALTGLANRALFLDRLGHALSRRHSADGSLAVLYVDLDEFKSVNDSLGHGEGDHLLVEVARRFREATRPIDTVARMGGDEFAVILEDGGATGRAEDVAARLLDRLREPIALGGSSVSVGASVGIALATADESDAERLLQHADVAMYTAKSRGKGRAVMFEPALYGATVVRLGIKNELRGALDRGELHLAFQPIVELTSERITGFEALARWDHPTRGSISPVDFIPLAEETGTIVALGRWVLDEATRQLRAWQTLTGNPAMTMSVNISGRQIIETGLIGEVAGAIASSGIDPSCLTLEITESVLLQDTEAAVTALRSLKALGVRLAIDDFGTGYSSLSYLNRFPIDVLKIDRSFVSSADGGEEQLALLRSIVGLGRTLHMQTVAEGIETADQARTLRGLGADLGQGFHFARPMSASTVVELLKTSIRAARPVVRSRGLVPVGSKSSPS